MSDEYKERASALLADLSKNKSGSGGDGSGKDGDEPVALDKKGRPITRRKKKLWLLIPLALLVVGGATYTGLVATGKVKSPLLAKKAATAKPTVEVAPPVDPAEVAAANAKLTADATKKRDADVRKLEADRKKIGAANQSTKIQGAKKIAKVWETMEPDAVAKVASNYRDPDLASIFGIMDAEKVGAVLATMDAKRAAKVSKLVQSQASALVAPSE